MAFDKAPSGTNNASNGIPANKKAIGFLNFYMPTEGGGRKKIGVTGIPLRESNANEKRLAEWLAEDPEARIQILLKTMIVDYTSVEPKEGSDFALPATE